MTGDGVRGHSEYLGHPLHGLRQVAEVTREVEEKITDSARLAHHLNEVFSRGGSFLIHEDRYLSAERAREAKDRFDHNIRRAAEDVRGLHARDHAMTAGWQLSTYISECRLGDRPEFGLLPIDERVLRSEELRKALVAGFRQEVSCKHDEDEERFPGSERSRRLDAQRDEPCSAFEVFVAQKAAELPAAPRQEKVLHRIVRQAAEQTMKSDQRERERIEAGHELAALMQPRAKGIEWDIVDMVYDDGLTPKEALALERQARLKPISFIGKDILAVQKEVKPVIEDSKAYREELAREFRRAIEALPPIPEQTCSWCGADIGGLDDHKIVDREPMCNACVNGYFPEGIER